LTITFDKKPGLSWPGFFVIQLTNLLVGLSSGYNQSVNAISN